MKKRALSLLLASFAAAACLACGCGDGGGSIIILDGAKEPAETSRITVYGHRCDRHSLGVIENALQGFMEVNPYVSASYESAAELQYWDSLDKRYKTGNLDDVFMTDRDRVIKMSADGALADISGAINANALNDFARSQLYGKDGAVYAVPACISTYGLYVNYTLLEKHGASVPRNLSEFTAVCDYFAGRGITPLVCNNYSSLRSLIVARGMYDTYCVADTESEISQFNADPSLLSERLNTGVDFVYSMIESGWIDPYETAVNRNMSDELALFAEGERPFMITGGWASSTLKEMLENSGAAMSYGIHPYPILDSASVLVVQADSLLSVKGGEKAERAKKLVTALTEPQTLLSLCENQSRFTVLKGQTQIYSDSSIIPSASYLTKGKFVVGSDFNLDVPLDGFLTVCGEMITGGESADDVKARLLDMLKEYSL